MDLFTSLLASVLRFLFRLLLVAMGLVFAASLLFVLLVFAIAWSLRALWARLSGRPVTPWVMRVDPRAGWSRFVKRPGQAPQGEVVDVDVVDVEARRLR